MIKLTASACIDASPEKVWATLAKLEDIKHWAEPIVRVSCDGEVKRGVGAERTCILRGGLTFSERWIEWREGETFTYEGVGLPFVKYARNTWSVCSAGPNRSLLSTDATMVLKGGWLGRALEPMMKIASARMSTRCLSAFKYLVEQGRPFTGKHSLLPSAPGAC